MVISPIEIPQWAIVRLGDTGRIFLLFFCNSVVEKQQQKNSVVFLQHVVFLPQVWRIGNTHVVFLQQIYFR
jgi:hypothetical protein